MPERECVCMKVSEHICLRGGERAVRAWWTLVLLREGRHFDFYPFLFLKAGVHVSLFLYNPFEVVELRRGKL